jgi:hypothetical protein
LTSISSGTYTQPFGSDRVFDAEALCDDARKLFGFVVGWQNRSGILVVFEGIEEATCVTDLQGPPSERTPEQKLWDLKTRAQQYARDRESCDDVRISYLEFLETEAEDDLALARMIAG